MFCFQFLQEVGRFIAVTFTARVCTKEWELPGFPGVVIPKGMKVLIPVDPVQVIWCNNLVYKRKPCYNRHTLSRGILSTLRIQRSSTLTASAPRTRATSKLAPTFPLDWAHASAWEWRLPTWRPRLSSTILWGTSVLSQVRRLQCPCQRDSSMITWPRSKGETGSNSSRGPNMILKRAIDMIVYTQKMRTK